MEGISKRAAAVAVMLVLASANQAQAKSVGAMAEVRQNVYGVAPESSQAVKRKGDHVVFQERLETLDDSGALVRFIDDSKLSLGAKSKVMIDEFVFDPKNAEGVALINISVGTLRWVTGDMPKGGTVIKTPTATLVLRGTEIIVHVHPDGTTDATVLDGRVEASNNFTNELTNLMPGDAITLGQTGTTHASREGGPDSGTDTARNAIDGPENRRGEAQEASGPQRSEASAGGTAGGNDSGGGAGNDGGGHDGGGHDGGDHDGGDHDGGGPGCGCH